MIQHHLVFHYTSIDDGNTYYEADLQSAYYLVRAGKILEHVQETLGSYAATVLSTIMYLGHTEIRYLETLPEFNPEQQPKMNGTNESHEVAAAAEEEEEEAEEEEKEEHQQNGGGDQHNYGHRDHLHPTLATLAAHGYIIKVCEAHFQNPNDIFLEAERVIKARSDIKMLKGKKYEENVKVAVAEMIASRTNGDLTEGLIYNGVPRGVKRRRAVRRDNAPNKRPRVDSTVADEDDIDADDDDESSDDETYDTSSMRVSYSI